MVKKKWEHVLICEDDIVLGRDLKKRFEQGVKELKKNAPNWDLLYLGCGDRCGDGCIGWDETTRRKHLSQVAEIIKEEWYVCKKEDFKITLW